MAENEEERERGKVIALIDKATNSIESEIDPRLLKAIKMVVRYSDFELKLAAQTLIQLMKRPHSQIRYLALLIIDELFMRSKLFRTLITENMDQLLSLSVGFRRNQPLPAPPSVATILRSKAIEFLEKWNHSYGIYYRQIRLGYHYLKDTLRYQFPNLQANAARVEQERKERELRTQEILRNKFESMRESLPSIREGIRMTIDEIEQCLAIAKANDENVMGIPLDDDDDEEFETRNLELRQIRVNALKEADKIHENTENKVLFDALREAYKLLVTKHFVSVQQWISVIVRVDVDDTRFRDSTLKEFIDFRNQILLMKKKCEESGCTMLNIEQNEEDDIWEEGKSDYMETMKELKESKTANILPPTDVPECSTRRASKRETIEAKKGMEKAKVGTNDSNSLKGKLLAKAPVVNWGSALDMWGEKRDAMANQRGLELDGHWGRVDHDATIPAEKIAELNFHASVYEEEQVEIPLCRATLRKGGFCQRRDLRVCPFHGPIIPRDDLGIPLRGEDGGASVNKEGPDNIPARESISPEELNIDGEDLSMEQLAKKAVKNVRERDKEETKKIERALKKAKLAMVREHNDVVLREASTSRYAGFGDYGVGTIGERAAAKSKKPTLASMLKKKVTVKDRLAQKLSSVRTRNTTMKHPM